MFSLKLLMDMYVVNNSMNKEIIYLMNYLIGLVSILLTKPLIK